MTLKISTIIDLVASEVAFHARTQTRYHGPDRKCAWHCDCGETGESSGRQAAIKAHREHVKQVILDLTEKITQTEPVTIFKNAKIHRSDIGP